MRNSESLSVWSRGVTLGRWRVLRRIASVLVAVLASWWLLWVAAGLSVEWLWFESLGYGGVFLRRTLTSAALFVIGAGVFALLLFGNLRLAGRLPLTAPGEAIAGDRLWAYLERVSIGLEADLPRIRRVEIALVIAGGLLAVMFGMAAAASADGVLLALAGVSFDLSDPLFGRDAGFYVFWLPILRALHGWTIGAVLAISIGTLVLYLARGRYELRRGFRQLIAQLPRRPRLHLAALGAAFFLTIVAAHQLELAEVVLGTSGRAFGLSFSGYVEANGRVPGLWAASVAALVAAGLLVVAAQRPTRRLVVAGPSLWLAALVLGWLWAAALEILVLKPNESVLERPYLERVRTMTRAAYGLDGLVERAIPAEEQLTATVAQAHAPTLANVRLWEPRPLLQIFTQLQAGRPYYVFPFFPDFDRYSLGGQLRPVMMAVRELDPAALPARTWVTTRVQFTHGSGVVTAQASAVGPDGRPVFVERELTASSEPGLSTPEVYFGERTTAPALVRTSGPEPASTATDGAFESHYTGRDGVPLAQLWSRLAHAISLGDQNLLLSPAIGAETMLLHRRQVAERVQALIPFMLLDADPYPVAHAGRIVWMLDGYTHTDRFPLAPQAPARLLEADPRPDITRQVRPNYLRGAVKATVDAYDGTVTLYLVDASDPIATAVARAYPGLLRPIDSMPPELRAHLRYPRQLFAAQADVLARFHVADSARLYSGEDAWLVARGRLESRGEVLPSYALQRLPGEQADELALTVPYRPYSQANDRHNLVALLAARSDPPSYGQLVLYRYPRDRGVEGPFQAELRIDQDPTISAQLGLWQRSGAQVIRGDVQTIPLGNSVLYVQSVYLQRSERAALPELQRVVAASGGRVAMQPTLGAAVGSIVGQPISLPNSGADAVDLTERAAEPRDIALAARAHLERAREALLAGDRAVHERELSAALQLLERLVERAR